MGSSEKFVALMFAAPHPPQRLRVQNEVGRGDRARRPALGHGAGVVPRCVRVSTVGAVYHASLSTLPSVVTPQRLVRLVGRRPWSTAAALAPDRWQPVPPPPALGSPLP